MHSALTVKADAIANVLVSDINIHIPNTADRAQINAIWDTGATSCAITMKVAYALKLPQTGFAQVNTANGLVTQPTFTVDIGLPNGVLIQSVLVTGVDGLSSGCEALIGMDIITLGDFSITNHNGRTCMSFRVPSSHEIDYVENINYGITKITNVNDKKPDWLKPSSGSYARRGKKK